MGDKGIKKKNRSRTEDEHGPQSTIEGREGDETRGSRSDGRKDDAKAKGEREKNERERRRQSRGRPKRGVHLKDRDRDLDGMYAEFLWFQGL